MVDAATAGYINLEFGVAWLDRSDEVKDAANVEEGGALSDADISLASGGTVYRLREGIERFFISDINNPAASAMAQSEIFVMFDFLTTTVERFNHVPGGSNFLYMDGHVKFGRFGQEPATRALAVFFGAE